MASPRRFCGLVVAAALSLSTLAMAAPAAQAASDPQAASASRPHTVAAHPTLVSLAATGYKYWGFYDWNPAGHTWTASNVGANDKKAIVNNGAVYGFRWALVVGVSASRPPRADGSFQQICGSTPAAPSGQARVAFVIDYGTRADANSGDTTPAPRGTCAVVSDKYTVMQALMTVATVRQEGGFLYGINGYPSSGKTVTVK
ncbi:MAG: SCO2322 family protein, partial [Nocardioidaceae bacterium]